MRLPSRCLVVLVGASGSGKSTWAAEHFRPEQIVSTDGLRAVVGETTGDQRASKDVFELVDRILARRLRRRLLTVVDSTGLDGSTRRRWIATAAEHGLPTFAVVFDTPAAECRARNRARRHPVPERALASQLRRLDGITERLAEEPFEAVLAPAPVRIVPPAFVAAPAHRSAQEEDPMTLRFGLSIPRFTWAGDLHVELARVVRAAEDAGFHSVWLMDHLVQIPSIGPRWEPMVEPYTTLGYLAGVTDRIELGALVTCVTYRNLAFLGKVVATLDVLSGGRAWCGLGAGWFGHEHELYGYDFPDAARRYDLLEDALELLPVLWGPGTPPFQGRTVRLPEAVCYPRPVREPRPPILVGGVGERRTLRLVAEHADACNLPGDADLVRRKVALLRRHCAEVGRDPEEVLVSQLGDAVVGRDRDEVARLVHDLQPPDRSPETVAERSNAGTVEDQVGRYRELAEAGVGLAVVGLPPVPDVEAIERFAPVVEAFAG